MAAALAAFGPAVVARESWLAHPSPRLSCRAVVRPGLFLFTAVLAVLQAASGCAPGAVVSAPVGAAQQAGRQAAARTQTGSGACGQSWALEDAVGGDARVIIVCGTDLRRAPIAVGAMTRALDPPLDAARERVCACAGRVAPPASVDLVVTALPGEGRATVEPGDADASTDPTTAQAFGACVGSLSTTFPAFDAKACDDGSPARYVYALSVEL